MASPLNFPDIVFLDDLDPFGSEITSDQQGLEQDVRHIIEQVLGSNPDDQTIGIGIGGLLSGTASDLARVPGQIDHQLGEDDRIVASLTTIEQRTDGSWSIVVQIQVDTQVVTLGYSLGLSQGLQISSP